MKLTKKVLSVLLVMSVVCGVTVGVIPSKAEAASGLVIKNHIVTDYTGSASTITIPKSVVKIGPSAFKGCKTLTTVKFAAGTTMIQTSAFANCTSLITCPSGLKSSYKKLFTKSTGYRSTMTVK